MVKRLFLFFGIQAVSLAAFACPLCHSSTSDQVRAGIASAFSDGTTVPSLLIPFMIVAAFLFFAANKKVKIMTISGVLLGVGMGGFIDGIVLHQLLQVHNMLSARYFPDNLVAEQINMFWDGLFHVFTWVVTAIGLFLFWKATQQNEARVSGRFLLGSMAIGWGNFNFLEGLLNHQILGIHNVVQRAAGAEQLMWDISFLMSGVILMLVGYRLRKKAPVEQQQQKRRQETPVYAPV